MTQPPIPESYAAQVAAMTDTNSGTIIPADRVRRPWPRHVEAIAALRVHERAVGEDREE